MRLTPEIFKAEKCDRDAREGGRRLAHGQGRVLRALAGPGVV